MAPVQIADQYRLEGGVEKALSFTCRGASLPALLHLPDDPGPVGVLVVVGGPQYRVGSHRQFTLLARHLARHRIPVFRFDYRGMGDAGGDAVDFAGCDSDLQAAMDCFRAELPAMRAIVPWGLCDAATAVAMFLGRRPDVAGMVLLNPWVRSEAGIARSYIKRYYVRKLLSGSFWRSLLSGRINIMRSVASFLGMVASVLRGARRPAAAGTAAPPPGGGAAPAGDQPLAARMLAGLQGFGRRTLVVLSGNDLTAGEFRDAVQASRGWRRLVSGRLLELRELAAADHTFSTPEWRDQVAEWTAQYVTETAATLQGEARR